ncbi:MAG: hypothetical protein ACI4S4_04550, partial [Candidatus Ornithospirochaeta sp.]
LRKIQKILDICSILYKIAYWACLVGACLCVLGLVLLALAQFSGLVSEEAARAFVDMEEEGLFSTAYASVLIGLVNTTFSFLVSRKWLKYFNEEKKDGTPFSEKTGKLLFDVAKYSLIMGFTAFIISVVLDGVFLAGEKTGIDVKFGVDISFVLFTMFLSLVFRYGAAVKDEK